MLGTFSPAPGLNLLGEGTLPGGGIGGTDFIMDGRGQLDSEALAFIVAAGLTDATQISSIHFLVGALKWASLWAKMTAVYPFVGAAAMPHSKDLRAAYNITWNGGVTHDVNGITGNGSTGYGDTGINANSVLNTASNSAGVYSRTNSSENVYEIGSFGSSNTKRIEISSRWADGKIYYANGEDGDIGKAISRSDGFIMSSKTSSTSSAAYQNGIVVNAGSVVSSSFANNNILISALNNNGTPTQFSARNLAFAFIGLGLSTSESKTMNLIVRSFQNILGRRV